MIPTITETKTKITVREGKTVMAVWNIKPNQRNECYRQAVSLKCFLMGVNSK